MSQNYVVPESEGMGESIAAAGAVKAQELRDRGRNQRDAKAVRCLWVPALVPTAT